ncbi:MAG: hypothetical protein ACI9YE_002802, partial [Psychroserpens sp.]
VLSVLGYYYLLAKTRVKRCDILRRNIFLFYAPKKKISNFTFQVTHHSFTV